MKNNNDYSDEFLNAYIDGELDPEETGRMLDELRYNEVLSARITDLQKVREMVRYAYHEKVPPTQGLRVKSSVLKKSRMAFAASIILSLGMALGWGLHLHSQTNAGLLDIAEAMQIKPAASSTNGEIKLVLHVTTDSKHKLRTVLDETEKLLKQYENATQKVQLDILTNGNGLKLLHAGYSPFSQRIKNLQKRYQNLTFKACQNAINRVRQKTGKEIVMLPDTVTVPSALGEIIKKQREGWSYIKI
jgi:intracellular sulfur oxidation DsrE/DsrF family protein